MCFEKLAKSAEPSNIRQQCGTKFLWSVERNAGKKKKVLAGVMIAFCRRAKFIRSLMHSITSITVYSPFYGRGARAVKSHVQRMERRMTLIIVKIPNFHPFQEICSVRSRSVCGLRNWRLCKCVCMSVCENAWTLSEVYWSPVNYKMWRIHLGLAMRKAFRWAGNRKKCNMHMSVYGILVLTYILNIEKYVWVTASLVCMYVCMWPFYILIFYWEANRLNVAAADCGLNKASIKIFFGANSVCIQEYVHIYARIGCQLRTSLKGVLCQ